MRLRATRLNSISSGRLIAPVVPSVWTPSAFGAALALWLDAADASTITPNGSTVSQWRDKSGNARNASQATAANQPTRTLNGLGGRAVITFDGVNDFLNATLTLTNFSVGMVGTLTANTATIYYPLGFGNAPSGSNGLSVGGTYYTQKAAMNGVTGLLTNETVTLNSPYLITAHAQTGDRLISFNGQTPATDTNSQSISQVTIGQRSDGFWPYAGPIGEVVITNTALSTANRQLLEGYLAWKWSGLIDRPWTPAQLPGLALWLDAADAGTITLNGSTVAQWNDKSGNARHASQATAANQPVYDLVGGNGRPILDFDGVSDSLTLASTFGASTANLNVFTAARGGPSVVAQKSMVLGTADGCLFNLRVDSQLRATSGSAYAVNLAAADVFGSYGFVCGSSGANLLVDTFVNGNPVTTNSFAGTAYNTNYTTHVARGDGSGGTTTSSTKISEIIVTLSSISTTNRQLLEGYLAWKWSNLL